MFFARKQFFFREEAIVQLLVNLVAIESLSDKHKFLSHISKRLFPLL